MLARLILFLVVGSAAPVLSAAPAAPVAQPAPLSIEQVMDLVTVTSAVVAPDGEHVAFTVSVPRKPDEEPGSRRSEVWVAPVAGGEPRLFVPADNRASSVTFTPDSRALAFLRSHGEPAVTQVFVLPIAGGEASPVTASKENIEGFAFSRDGTRLAYTTTDPKTEEEKKTEKNGEDWVVVDAEFEFRRLHVLDLATKESTQITQGDLQVIDFEWSPEGDRLAARVADTPLTDDEYMFTRLVMLDPAGGAPQTLFATVGKLGAPRFSPDADRVLYTGAVDINDPYDGSLFVGSSDGGVARNLSGDFEGTVMWADWLANGSIAVVTTEFQQTALRIVDPDGDLASSRVVHGGPEVFQAASFSELAGDACVFAFAGSTPRHPPELFVGRLDGQAPERRTHHNHELDDLVLGEQSVYRWTARDGLPIEGVLVRPAGPTGGPAPLVLNVHGGPEGVVLNGWNTSYGYWSQILATRGFAVLLPNYRGSIGRGVAFSKADHKDLGGSEFIDVIDGVDALARDGLVDPKRVGIGGGSYGGYFSAWAATRHTDRFAAAITFAGISNWVSMLGTSDIPRENLLVHWNLPAEGNLGLFMERSPIQWVAQSRTPTLILHGLKDLRVPIGQSTELYTVMKLLGKPVEYVQYPREPHGIRERAHQIDFARRAVEWYTRHLMDQGPAVDAGDS